MDNTQCAEGGPVQRATTGGIVVVDAENQGMNALLIATAILQARHALGVPHAPVLTAARLRNVSELRTACEGLDIKVLRACDSPSSADRVLLAAIEGARLINADLKVAVVTHDKIFAAARPDLVLSNREVSGSLRDAASIVERVDVASYAAEASSRYPALQAKFASCHKTLLRNKRSRVRRTPAHNSDDRPVRAEPKLVAPTCEGTTE